MKQTCSFIKYLREREREGGEREEEREEFGGEIEMGRDEGNNEKGWRKGRGMKE